MQCRRCGKELPFGQKGTCPHCGIHLNTIITPRGGKPKSKTGLHRATVMSLLSVGLVVLVVLVVIPFFRNIHMNAAIEHIETVYTELNGNRYEFTEDDWIMRLATFSAAINNFERGYPNEGALIDKFRRYELELNGYDPDDPDRPPPSEQEEFDQYLIAYAKEKIIDIIDLSASDAGVSVRIRNASDRIIVRVRMAIEGFDANGNSLGQGHIQTDINRPILPQTEDNDIYTGLWSGETAANVRIEWLEVNFGPERIYFFRPEVCAALWP